MGWGGVGDGGGGVVGAVGGVGLGLKIGWCGW